MQKPRPLPTRPGHRAGSEREPGRVRAGFRGLSSVRGAPSEIGDQEAAHAGLPRTAPVRPAPHKASGLDVRPRGGSGHEGPRGSPGTRAAFPLRSRARPVASFSCGSAGRALGWGPRAWEARAGFQHVVNAAARRGGASQAPTHTAACRHQHQGPEEDATGRDWCPRGQGPLALVTDEGPAGSPALLGTGRVGGAGSGGRLPEQGALQG